MPIVPHDMPRPSRPGLAEATPDPAAQVLAPNTRRVIVKFTDGSLHLCWVRGWQRRRNRWLVHLAWGDRGQVKHGWYVHDERHVAPPPWVRPN